MMRAGSLKPRSLALAIVLLLSFVSLNGTHRAIAQSDPEFERSITAQTDVLLLQEVLFDEINALRKNPQAYAEQLVQLKPYFNGNTLSIPGKPPRQTAEGVKAVDEAIEALKTASPMPELEMSSGLSRAAQDHVDDIGAKGIASRMGSDGSKPADRINRHGESSGEIADSLVFSRSTNPRMQVMALLIDDGIESRQNRKILLNPNLKKMGAACGSHAKFGYVCVMNYAAKYTEKSQ